MSLANKKKPLLFVALATPTLGWLLQRWQSQFAVSRWQWSVLVFWTLFTHSLLDCCTTYGTQIFQPFSDYPVALSSIFVIDPLYTLPLLFGLIIALWLHRTASARRYAIVTGLGLSTLYLLFTLGSRWHVETVFRDVLQAHQQPVQRLWVMPTAFNSLLWIGLAEDGDELRIGHYSLLDRDRNIRFQRVAKNQHLIAPWQDDPAIQRLLWFSRGFYTVRAEAGTLRFDDLHLPRTDVWLTSHGDAIFSYRLHPDPAQPARLQTVERVRPQRFRDGMLALLLNRLLGNTG